MERLLNHLRAATAADHDRLEQALDLLAAPPSRCRFRTALAGFHAFHRAWEPEVEALIDDPAFMAPRRKIALAARDLGALGGAPLPLEVDLSFLGGASQAWGSLYVMEGSSLGGQVISKALRSAAWAPVGGLGYFNPYGECAGAMWRTFRAHLEARSEHLDVTAAAEAARATFAEVQAVIAAAGRLEGARR